MPPVVPGAGRVGAPEAVEDHRGLARLEADAVVAHGQRGRPRRRPDADHDLLAVGVVDGVGDQVAHDPLDPADVDLGHARPGAGADHDVGAAPLGQRAGAVSATRCATSARLTSSRSSTAAPASKRLISSRSVSSCSKRSSSFCSSSAERAVTGSKRVAGVVQHVAGHPHRGQRGAQLVGDVGDEAALHPGQLLELADLLLQAGGHLVERRAEPGDVVLAADVHALLEPARGEPLGDPAGQPHRGDHLAGDQPGDAADQDQQQRRRR